MFEGHMEAASEEFRRLLQSNPDVSSLLWTINTRETLFRYVNTVQNNLHGHFPYSIRIDGALTSLSGFASLVRDVISVPDGNALPWEAMIWGSSALILAQLYERRAGHEQILAMFEDLTVTPILPTTPLQKDSTPLHSFVLQLFAELSTQLLSLALALQKYPQAPQRKQTKFVEFEVGHMKGVQRIKVWADRLRLIPSTGASLSTQKPNPVPLPSERIPVSVNKHFHGRRRDLEAIHDRIHNAIERPAAVCVHGLPGIGKTQLAALYCKTFGAEYFACIWVAADNHTKIGNGLAHCAVEIKLEGASTEAEPRKNAQSLVSWLQTTDKLWLVVFDNIDDVHQLEDFWPSGGSGHIIMTSRSPYVSEFRDTTSLELLPLSQTESRELFYKIVGKSKEKQHNEEMEKILAEWKGVPLALYHIGSYISRVHVEVTRFPKIYRSSAARIYQSRHCTDGYTHSIATAFSISELEERTKAVLMALCYFDPDKIPKELLLSSFDYDEPLIQIATEFDLYDALVSLCKSGLISQTDENVTLHRLVQDVAFSYTRRDEKVSTFHQVLHLMQRRFPRETEGKPMWEEWARCSTYLPHVMFLCLRVT